ncbi:hypothetical protein BOTBODRAFT_29114 [Botryobasidium botryosum FD-172 SS1]|uniref:G domain-containing protein n=1 Tax=Botryobasidium botryosum (strain FD-172 SS1) TaxID=930990 RepID=A0A067MSM1_BOTB1|nr:hypothetical protein BOTBODRAFT_29114 [Botryobasidium botryosum FD-172 SS1]
MEIARTMRIPETADTPQVARLNPDNVGALSKLAGLNHSSPELVIDELEPGILERRSSKTQLSKKASSGWPPLTAKIEEIPLQGEVKVIMVMGGTGVGKSTFVNTASGGNLGVGHNLKSHTTTVQGVLFELDGIRVCLIDIPGFNDSVRSEIEILWVIADCLVNYPPVRDLRITGMIYLHRISDNRVSGATQNNLDICRKICGDDALKNMIMCTTMWDLLSPDAEVEREREHELKRDFWAPMIDNGAVTTRHDGTIGSAQDIIRTALQFEPTTSRIQYEILAERKKLEDTAAGAHIRRALTALEERHAAALREVEVDLAKAIDESDAVLQRVLESDRQQ